MPIREVRKRIEDVEYQAAALRERLEKSRSSLKDEAELAGLLARDASLALKALDQFEKEVK
jgi:hypothetical protein